MFAFLRFMLSAFAQFPDLAGTPHDLILDPLARFVLDNRLIAFLRSDISRVSMSGLFLSV